MDQKKKLTLGAKKWLMYSNVNAKIQQVIRLKTMAIISSVFLHAHNYTFNGKRFVRLSGEHTKSYLDANTIKFNYREK